MTTLNAWHRHMTFLLSTTHHLHALPTPPFFAMRILQATLLFLLLASSPKSLTLAARATRPLLHLPGQRVTQGNGQQCAAAAGRGVSQRPEDAASRSTGPTATILGRTERNYLAKQKKKRRRALQRAAPSSTRTKPVSKTTSTHQPDVRASTGTSADPSAQYLQHPLSAPIVRDFRHFFAATQIATGS